MPLSPFKKTFYYGLLVILIPISLTGIILLLYSINSPIETRAIDKVEVVIKPKEIIQDTVKQVVQEKPKKVIQNNIIYNDTPKIIPEKLKVDSIVVDTFNHFQPDYPSKPF
jgi:hypothetical protein